MPMQQLTISLENSLTQQFPQWMDVVRASVYDCGRPFKVIAADLDMSVSELSRRLSPADNLPLALEDLPKLLGATGDLRPVYWMVESFLEDDTAKTKRAVDQLHKLMPQIHSLLNQVSK
jgi:hypothetical protein